VVEVALVVEVAALSEDAPVEVAATPTVEVAEVVEVALPVEIAAPAEDAPVEVAAAPMVTVPGVIEVALPVAVAADAPAALAVEAAAANLVEAESELAVVGGDTGVELSASLDVLGLEVDVGLSLDPTPDPALEPAPVETAAAPEPVEDQIELPLADLLPAFVEEVVEDVVVVDEPEPEPAPPPPAPVASVGDLLGGIGGGLFGGGLFG
ncbi:MAG: hypothetical protein AB7O45_04250, partial [Alphaproteobacteria bacterium]